MEKIKGIKVLVVEDEGIIALSIKRMLESSGYTVPGLAATGEEAVRMAELISPDIILMDVKLKGNMDGIETAEEIRRRFDIPVIYLTAYPDSKVFESAKKTEPYAYMVKPFRAEDLKNNIETVLYRSGKNRIE